MNDDWLALGCAILAIMLALIGIVLPESSSFPSNYPYGNLTGIPNTFPYSNLTGIPQTFPYSNLTGIPSTFPYGNLTGVPNIDLMHGLALWLPFDGVALDKSGYRLDGTVNSVSYVTGKFDKALSFDGSTSYVSVSSSPLISVYNKKSFSFSAWVHVGSGGENNWGRIVDKDAGYGFLIAVHDVGGSFIFLAETIFSVTSAVLQTSTTFSYGVWYSVSMVFNATGNNKIQLYVNNSLPSLSSDIAGVGSVVDDSSKVLFIGDRLDHVVSFDGLIDEARFYNRGLNQAEIYTLYNLP